MYSPKCTPLEQEKTYSWSTIDNKPETNATTNCISAIMDINGNKKPNRIGKDVRSWNSFYGSRSFGADTGQYSPLSYQECRTSKDKLGIKKCFESPVGTQRDDDYWGGAVKKCHELGLHLPGMQMFAMAAGAKYGLSNITPYGVISTVQWAKTNWDDPEDESCEQILKKHYPRANQTIICIDKTNINNDDMASIGLYGNYWLESGSDAVTRRVDNTHSVVYTSSRNYKNVVLCVGD